MFQNEKMRMKFWMFDLPRNRKGWRVSPHGRIGWSGIRGLRFLVCHSPYHSLSRTPALFLIYLLLLLSPRLSLM